VWSLTERKNIQNKNAAKRLHRYDLSLERILFFWDAAGQNCFSFLTHNPQASGKVKVMDSRKSFFQTLIQNMTSISEAYDIVEALCKNGSPI